MNIQKLFTAPIILDDVVKKEVLKFLRIILIVALITLPILLTLKIISQSKTILSDYFLASLIILLGIYYILLQKSKGIFWVITAFIITSWASMLALSYVGAGIHDVTVVVFVLIIFIAALLAGYRMALLMTVLSILSVWFLVWAEITNIEIVRIDTSVNYGRDFSVIIIIVLTLIVLYERNFQQSYNRVYKELQDRKWAEIELLQNEFKLKEKNEEYQILNKELTESNSRILNLNISLQRAKDKAEESDRLKSAFLQNISHEIRTPLNGIMGFTELLKASEIDDNRDEYIDIIKTSCKNLSTIMDDLIDISKIEAKVIDIHISNFSLVDLFNELEKFFTKSAKDKNLEFYFSIDFDDPQLESDKGRITQILNNLISNAIKFTKVGFVKIQATRDDKNLRISVIDSGVGISEKNLEIIFDRFIQADMGLSRMYSGTGLGLSIAKGLAEYLDGSISVKSIPEKGSEFTLTIPVTFSADDKILPIEQKAKVNLLNNLKILVAEDEEINFRYFMEILKRQNCEVTWARNGIEAIDIFKQRMDFDMVLMDIKMPEMNGYEATLKIREINKIIPIIAITAFAINKEHIRSTDLYFDDYITKPITPDELLDRIRVNLTRNK